MVTKTCQTERSLSLMRAFICCHPKEQDDHVVGTLVSTIDQAVAKRGGIAADPMAEVPAGRAEPAGPAPLHQAWVCTRAALRVTSAY